MSESKRLNWSQILQVNPQLKQLAEEEQENVNHPDCPAGHDSKRRLYVRKRDGGLVGYCQHCRSTGGLGGKRNHIASRQRVQVQWNLKLPADFTLDMHVAGLAWLNKYGITREEQITYNIGWSERSGRVILPIYIGGKLIAYQSRRMFDYDKGPKYLTDKQQGVRHPMFLGTKRGPAVVLTEDMLSAIVVSRQHPAAALLGVHLNDTNLYELLKLGFKRFVVWLDDDGPAVRKAQRDIVKKLSNFGDTCKITAIGHDPKEMSHDEINSILSRRANGAQASVPSTDVRTAGA